MLVPQLPADTIVVDETSLAEVILPVVGRMAKMEYRSFSPAARLVVPEMVNGSPASWSLTGFTRISGDEFVVGGAGGPGRGH